MIFSRVKTIHTGPFTLPLAYQSCTLLLGIDGLRQAGQTSAYNDENVSKNVSTCGKKNDNNDKGKYLIHLDMKNVKIREKK